MSEKNTQTVEVANTEVGKLVIQMNTELASETVRKALLATTFKGLAEPQMKQACLEGMMRGFTIKNFLERDVYALPFKQGYSLVTSIGYARKLAMRTNRYLGKSAPVFEMNDKGTAILSCEITVKALVSNHVGDFTALVDFKEYSTGDNQWAKKPKTMIAKVAEMHALRMAFPEELSNSYSEEEVEKELHNPMAPVNEMVQKSKLTMGDVMQNNIKDADIKENKNNKNAEDKDGVEYAGGGEESGREDIIE